MKLLTAIVSVALLAVPVAVAAHSGGTDKNGCHTNRKTGDRHCHGARGGSGNSGTQGLRSGPAGGRAFANCAAARAAGAAPVRQGDPGYGPHLDRDRDGIGCE